MSQAIRGGIIILVALLVAAVGVAGWVAIQKKNLEDKYVSLQEQLSESQKKQEKAVADAKKLQEQTDDLKKRVNDATKQKDEAQGVVEDLKSKADQLSAQIDQLNQEKDSWKNRLSKVTKERDEAVAKLQNQPEKVVYKEKVVEAAPVEDSMPSGNPDEYWSGVLKQKAALQVQLDKANEDLNNAALQVADLRKQSSDLQLQIKQLSTDKDEIERRLTNENKAVKDQAVKERQDLLRKVKDAEDLANNLSIETIRARGDQKNANDFVGKVKEDNTQMQSQVRQLVATKVALQKTVARLTEEKANLTKKLSETEGVIQDRINEIWQIKNTLDQKISSINDIKSGSKEVSLPPIVVNSSGDPSAASTQTHKIISFNDKNNFVIVDYGETQGSTIGRILKAYRNDKEIATLEVIQVRRDISAADIKTSKTKLQVGDQVR